MESTLDVDPWVDLRLPQYMCVQIIVLKTGATMGADTVANLEGGTPVYFVFGGVAGHARFVSDYSRKRKQILHRRRVPVIQLQRIPKSKESFRCDKARTHIVQIWNLLRCRRALKARITALQDRKRR